MFEEQLLDQLGNIWLLHNEGGFIVSNSERSARERTEEERMKKGKHKKKMLLWAEPEPGDGSDSSTPLGTHSSPCFLWSRKI